MMFLANVRAYGYYRYYGNSGCLVAPMAGFMQ